jgi:hypothetical protein
VGADTGFPTEPKLFCGVSVLIEEQPFQGRFPRLPKALEAGLLRHGLRPEFTPQYLSNDCAAVFTATTGQRLHTDRTLQSVALELSDCVSETRNYKG